MVQEFPNRGDILFGREPDVAALASFCQLSGLTVVTGRARMGKSWTLTELARRLSIPNTSSLLSPAHLVGLVESRGEPGDLFLRCVVDLYSRWLAFSTFADQARVLTFLERQDLPGKAGKIVATLANLLSKLGPKPVETAGALVGEWMEGLSRLDLELKTGALLTPRLAVEQGQDLLKLLNGLTGRPLVLIFDQWERSPSYIAELSIFRTFLDHLDDWPPCHIVLGVRPEGPPWEALQTLLDDFRSRSRARELPPMHLEQDSQRAALLRYVRGALPSTAKMPDAALLDMIAGYPCVLADWVDPINYRRLDDPSQLKALAKEANDNRFVELTRLLGELAESPHDEELDLCIRLVLTPTTALLENWKKLRPLVLGGSSAKLLDSLRRKGVIEPGSGPNATPHLGHMKRYQAAYDWLKLNAYEHLCETVETLATACGSQIVSLDLSKDLPVLQALVSLTPFAEALTTSDWVRSLCHAAFALFQPHAASADRVIAAARQEKASSAATLIALALALLAVTAHRDQNTTLRDQLLEELRAFCSKVPGSTQVSNVLATALIGSLYPASDPPVLRGTALLDEIRELYLAHPEEPRRRDFLTEALRLNLTFNRSEDDSVRRSWLVELRRLVENSPAGQESLAFTLFGIFAPVTPESDNETELEDISVDYDILDELRSLMTANPGSETIRSFFSMALAMALMVAQMAGDIERSNALRDEMMAMPGGDQDAA